MGALDEAPGALPSDTVGHVMDELWEHIRARRPMSAEMQAVLHDALNDAYSRLPLLEALWRAEEALGLYRNLDAPLVEPTRQETVLEALRLADGNVVTLPRRGWEGIWHSAGGDAA